MTDLKQLPSESRSVQPPIDLLHEYVPQSGTLADDESHLSALPHHFDIHDAVMRSFYGSWILLNAESSSGDCSQVESIIHENTIELSEALSDLGEVGQESQEEGFPTPSDVAIENVDRLLNEMYQILPRRFEVYPTPDGEIAIDALGGYGRSVILLCDSAGGALCLVNMDGNHRSKRYPNANTLPDEFLHEALIELGS